MTGELLDAIRDLPKVVEYIDMPLQHIATSVLTAMRRGIDEGGTRALIERMRQTVPGCALRTTMLVGFPGESEEDFDALLEFTAEVRFTRLGAFAFSPEEGSIAARLPDPVPREIARERLARLLALQEGIQAGANEALIGGRAEVLVEGMTAEGLLRGRTRRPRWTARFSCTKPRRPPATSSTAKSWTPTGWISWPGAFRPSHPPQHSSPFTFSY